MEAETMSNTEMGQGSSADEDAPDGGWGWIVCFAVGISQITILPAMQQFDLIYKDHLEHLGLTSAQIGAIINTSNALSYLVAVISGPLFRMFSFRTVGVGSAMLVSFALFLTALSKSFPAYMLGFGVLFGASIGLSLTTGTIILNTYFFRKRRLANGVSWALASIGPFIMPYVTNLLLARFGVKGTVLVLSAISINSAVCALSFQPVSWHITREKLKTYCNPRTKSPEVSEPVDAQGIESSSQVLSAHSKPLKEEISKRTSILRRIARNFDLDLFKDFNYVITIFGLSIADFAEMNFNILMPSVLDKIGFTGAEIVTLLTLIALMDCCMRLLVPILVEKLGWKNRSCYLMGVVIMAIGRAILAYSKKYSVVFYTSFLIGFGKAVITVFLNLVTPSCVTIKRLPAATGIQMTMTGIFAVTGGPLVVIIKDKCSTTVLLHSLNVLTCVTVVLWSWQYIFCKKRQ
ncbi:monocarboxylate transporter 9-like isoform X2 [Hermetia illucens]|nr:monocarboxylate transporter 9-like isoform X2 [Hermetia illucens]